MTAFVAVKSGYYFALVNTLLLKGVNLLNTGTVVSNNGKSYPLYKGAKYEDAHKIDELIDNNGLRTYEIGGK